jgi:hypothetical protein
VTVALLPVSTPVDAAVNVAGVNIAPKLNVELALVPTLTTFCDNTTVPPLTEFTTVPTGTPKPCTDWPGKIPSVELGVITPEPAVNATPPYVTPTGTEVNVRLSLTAAVVGADNVTVPPLTALTVVPLGIPGPLTNIPADIPAPEITVTADAPELPTAICDTADGPPANINEPVPPVASVPVSVNVVPDKLETVPKIYVPEFASKLSELPLPLAVVPANTSVLPDTLSITAPVGMLLPVIVIPGTKPAILDTLTTALPFVVVPPLKLIASSVFA